MKRTATLVILTLLNLCPFPSREESPSTFTIVAEPWPEADLLFRRDARWIGGDDAYSIDLGKGRVLWLFGDSFIATGPARRRRESRMVRNSVAIQQGYDPSNAAIRFYWREDGGRPTSFFPEKKGEWYWPGHGALLDDTLILFLMKVRASSHGLGFDVSGWTAVTIDNPDEEPSRWNLNWLDTPRNDYRVIIGSASVLRKGDHLYAFSVKESTSHEVYVVRWPVSRAKAGDLTRPQWWNGRTKTWVTQSRLKRQPPPLFSGGQTEFTVHFCRSLRGFLQVQAVGFGPASIGFRFARKLTGKWSRPQVFYKPEEASRPRIMIYAAKAHPELKGAELVLTYATNSFDFARLVDDMSLYYPRFLRAEIEPSRCANEKTADTARPDLRRR